MNGLQHIEYYSDLPEPVPHSDLPETIARRPTWQVEKERWLPAHHGLSYEEKEALQNQQNSKSAQPKDGTSRRRRCGLVPCAFWTLIAAVVVVIVVAAVAGGIVGSQSQKNEKTASAGAAADDPPPNTNTGNTPPSTKTGNTATSGSATPTSSSDISLTTQTLYSGSRTLYRDCPSSNNTVYSYGSSTSPMLFRKWCGMACWNINGWAAMVNQDTDSLDDCMTCAQRTICRPT